MAVDKNKQDQAVVQLAAAILAPHLPKKLTDLLATVTENDLRGPDLNAETLKGTTAAPHVWVHSPGTFRFSALAQRRMTHTARSAGMTDTVVTRVHARLIGTSNTVLIKPASPLDPTAFEVAYYPGTSGGTVNLYALLGPARATVETGYRQRYDVHLVPRGSALWPGLLVDLDDPKERKQEPARKKKGTKSST